MLTGFILEKSIGVGQPKRLENAKVLLANTPMDTDKIKVFGSRVRVDSVAKVTTLLLLKLDKKVIFGSCLAKYQNPAVIITCEISD